LNKYTEQQKLDAVETYRSGELGLKKTAALHGVDVASLRKWVAGFEALGIAGIQQKRRQTYDLKFKLDVLQRMKADGLSCRQAGAIFNVRRCNSIAEWERAYSRDGIAGLMPHHAARRANRLPTLAQRHVEIKALCWPQSTLEFVGGKELRFTFSVAPNRFSRTYRCLLRIPTARYPELLVLDPDPHVLAGGRRVPHIYPHDGPGTKLCLWLPETHEWSAAMKLTDTYLPWAAEWLDYFEEWLVTNEWAGGGTHPSPQIKRWRRNGTLQIQR